MRTIILCICAFLLLIAVNLYILALVDMFKFFKKENIAFRKERK